MHELYMSVLGYWVCRMYVDHFLMMYEAGQPIDLYDMCLPVKELIVPSIKQLNYHLVRNFLLRDMKPMAILFNHSR